MNLLKLPAKFYDDHAQRDLPTPVEIKRTSNHVFVSLSDPALPELLDDAKHYAHNDGPTAGQPEYAGLRSSARATVAALTNTPKKEKP